MSSDARRCRACGRPLRLRRFRYRMESLPELARRVTCGIECASLLRYRGKQKRAIEKEARHQERQERKKNEFDLNLVREWLQEWR